MPSPIPRNRIMGEFFNLERIIKKFIINENILLKITYSVCVQIQVDSTHHLHYEQEVATYPHVVR